MRNWIIGLLALVNLQIFAQGEVSFVTKVSKEQLGINERLRVDFEMNKDGDNFTPPNFTGFRVISGPSQSVSTSWINGKSSYKKTYTYFLQPTEVGEYTIRQASIEIEGQMFKTTPLNIKVTKAVDKGSNGSSDGGFSAEDIKVVAELSKVSSIYVNETISIMYRVYFSDLVHVTNISSVDPPGFENFWHQNIRIQNYNLENKTLNGRTYRSFVCYQEVLYPQKSGKLKIDPLVTNLLINIPTGRLDFFGRPQYSQVSRTFSSNARLINVKALPTNKPDSFTGAVGQFKFSARSSKSSLKATESLQVVLEASGKGNLKLIKLPKLNMPSSIEVYDPESKENIKTTLGGMSGSVGESYTLVPQFKGAYKVPKIPFSYFDPSKKKYITVYSNELPINVTEGPVDTSAMPSSMVSSGVSRQQVVAPDQQFRFIKLKANWHPIEASYFLNSKGFFLLLLLPILTFPIVLLIFRKRKTDAHSENLRKANALAKKYLSDAKKKLADQDGFYIALEKALHNYLKAKLDVETLEISKGKIQELLLEKRVDTAIVDDLLRLMQTCEMARYGTQKDSSRDEVYGRAVNIISIMDK